ELRRREIDCEHNLCRRSISDCYQLFGCSWSAPPFGNVSRNRHLIGTCSQSLDQKMPASIRSDSATIVVPIRIPNFRETYHQPPTCRQCARFHLHDATNTSARVS